MVREGRVFISVATDPDFASGYSVQALEVGAQVASASAGTAITVRAGHGFAALDKLIVGTDTTTYRSVSSVGATTVNVNSSISVVQGDFLVNLGPDTGPTSPNYDGNGLSIYTDMDFSNLAVNRTVTTDSNGRYRYFHKGVARWELVRTGSTPIALYIDADSPAVDGPDTSTDKAVVRWSGTTGAQIQDSVVIIGDTGAVSGVTTLAVAGAVTGVTTLAASGAVTAASFTATAAVQGATVAATGAATVGTTLGVTGAVTASSTLGVTGATTLTGGVAGGIPRNIGTWSITAVGNGTSTTPATSTVYTGSIFVPANMTITGIQYMRGSAAAAAQKVIVSLHNATGTLLANSATAGTTVGTASQTHQVPFTSTYAAVGPAWYHVAVNFDTATAALFQTVPAFCNCGNGVVGNSIAQTFGTPATFAAPTTFTADKVPVASIY